MPHSAQDKLLICFFSAASCSRSLKRVLRPNGSVDVRDFRDAPALQDHACAWLHLADFDSLQSFSTKLTFYPGSSETLLV